MLREEVRQQLIEAGIGDRPFADISLSQFDNPEALALGASIQSGEGLTNFPVLRISGAKSFSFSQWLATHLVVRSCEPYGILRFMEASTLLDLASNLETGVQNILAPQYLFVTHAWSKYPLKHLPTDKIYEAEKLLRKRISNQGKKLVIQSRENFFDSRWSEGWWSHDFHCEITEQSNSLCL